MFNYEFIANELCVNKDKPELECHGKCHLEQEVKTATQHDTEDKNVPEKIVEKSTLYFQELSVDFIINDFDDGISKNHFYYQDKIVHRYLSVANPPPEC